MAWRHSLRRFARTDVDYPGAACFAFEAIEEQRVHDQPANPAQQNKEDMLLLYHNAQEWVRHYQNIVMQLNTWVTTFNAAVITLAVTSCFNTDQRPSGMFYSLLLPIGMSVVVIITTRLVDQSMREGFRQIVEIEDALGLFDLRARNGASLLPGHLRESPVRQWPQVFVWFIVDAVVILVCAVLFAYFYFAK